jgi:hypothetical protein
MEYKQEFLVGSDLKSELQKILATKVVLRSVCPPSAQTTSVAELYRQYSDKLENRIVNDPRGAEIHFYAENFPYLIKLEYYNRKIGAWKAAFASAAIEQLKSETFDEATYRIGDESRARTLFWIPEIISDPDSIHENGHPRVTGTELYVKRYKRSDAQIKVISVGTRSSGERIVVSSFWSNEGWVARYAKMPARYERK